MDDNNNDTNSASAINLSPTRRSKRQLAAATAPGTQTPVRSPTKVPQQVGASEMKTPPSKSTAAPAEGATPQVRTEAEGGPKGSAVATPVPEDDAGGKPEGTKKRLKKREGTPNKKPKTKNLTPSFKSKKENAKKLKRVEKNQARANEEAKVAKAASLINSTMVSTSLTIDNSMWMFVSECERNKDGDIVFLRVPVNHNCVNYSVAHEITNNILGNPIKADLSKKFYDESMGTDMDCLMTWNDKVCSSSVCA